MSAICPAGDWIADAVGLVQRLCLRRLLRKASLLECIVKLVAGIFKLVFSHLGPNDPVDF